MDADWSPDGNSTIEEDDDEYRPRPKTRRRTSSRKRKLSSHSHSEDMDVISSKPRRSSRRLSKTRPPLTLDNSDSDHSEHEPIKIINSNESKQRKKAEPTEEYIFEDDSEEIEIINTNTKSINKRDRKRKSEDINAIGPSPKKRKVLNSNKNTTNYAKKKEKESKKKGKKKKLLLKGNEATERVRALMVAQNRPHSKNSVHGEVMGAISVGQIQKSLDELKEEGVLVMREFGNKSKTKIYWVDQESLEEDDGDENEVMMRIKALEMKIKEKRNYLNGIKKEIAILKKEPTDNDLDFEMKKTVVLYKRSEEKLKELRQNQDESELVNQEVLDCKLIEFYKYGKAWKERKAAVMDMVSQIFINSNDKPDKILTKQLNGETDQDNDVDWEHYKEIYKLSARIIQQQKDKQRQKV